MKVKDNYQIYPVDSRGINFVGYVFYHTHALIRKSIKYKIIRLVNSYLNRLNHFPITFKITKYDWRIYTKSKKEKVKPQT